MGKIMSLSRISKISIALALAVSVAGCTVVDRMKTDLALQNAQDAYAEGRYAESANIYRELANTGNGEAAFQLSNMYLNGQGVQKDRAAGVQWMEKASQDNFHLADLSIGLWTMGGLNGFHRDQAKGAQIILGAAQAGQPEAMIAMGYLFMKGRGVKPDANQALEWFQKAKMAGSPVDPDLLTLGGVQKKMGVRR